MSKTITLLVVLILFIFQGVTFSWCPSDSALIRTPVMLNPLIWKMTKSVTNDLWGIDLYYFPYSATQSYRMEYTQLLTGMAFSVDHSWHRIIYSECLSDWIKAYGSYGSGAGQFNFPEGIASNIPVYQGSYIYYVYVADTRNNRIVKLKYDYSTEQMSYDGEITGGGLYKPHDVYVDNSGTFTTVGDDWLWVINGDDKIKKFTLAGELFLSYGATGSGTGQFDTPLAVACGRSVGATDPYANNEYIYVCDTYNSRVVRLREDPENCLAWMETWDAPPMAFLSSIEVDNFGQVWLTDKENCLIYKLSPNLELLTIFGGEGTGPNQFIKPLDFANTGGNQGCGNVFIVEYWDEESGGQYFAIGVDMCNLYTVEFETDYSWHSIHFFLIDPADVTLKIYDEDSELVKIVMVDAFRFWGDQSGVWLGTDESETKVPSGNYRAEVKAVSGYQDIDTGEPVNSVTGDVWICNVHPDDIMGDVDSDGQVGLADVTYLINYLFSGGPPPEPRWKGDVDASCGVGLSDITYLIGYFFKGGPAPRWNFECERWWRC